MRIFEQGAKINFADINDVYVGFDGYQCCCESFGYFFARSAESEEEVEAPANLEEMIFDVTFFGDHGDDPYTAEARFRLIQPTRVQSDRTMRARERTMAADGGSAEIFLVIFNHHNGYYGHGFEMTHGGTVVQSGAL